MIYPDNIPDWALIPAGVVIYGSAIFLSVREHVQKMRRIRAMIAAEDRATNQQVQAQEDGGS